MDIKTDRKDFKYNPEHSPRKQDKSEKLTSITPEIAPKKGHWI